MSFDWVAARDALSELRTSNQRDSQEIVDKGTKLVTDFFSNLGEEKWVVLEQVFLAALDCGDFQLSDTCLKKLQIQFPGSCRVQRLKGIQHEARGEFHKALIIYNKLLADDGSDMATMKRKVAVLVGTGQPKKAISLLNDYLQVFMADVDAWAQLANLYLDSQMYKQACFCLEELILADPQNYHYYVKLAEAKYTLGGPENLTEALHYFSFALLLSKENNLRAFYGLCLATSILNTIQKGLAPEAVSAYLMAKETILAASRPDHQRVVKALFQDNLDFPT